MVQSSARRNIRSGIPWWIWGILLVVGVSVFAGIVVQLIPSNPDDHYERALAAFDTRDAETLNASIAAFRDAGGDPSKQTLLEALDWIAKSRPLKAIPLLEEVIDDPELRHRAVVQLGEAYMRAGDYASCVESLRKAISEDTSPLRAHTLLAQVLYDLGAPQEAIESASALIEGNHEESHAHRIRGQSWFRLGEYEKAADDLAVSMETDPTDYMNAAVAINLVASLNRTEQYEEALNFIASADSGAPREGVRAAALLGLGKPEEAFQVIDKVLGELAGQPEPFVTFARAVLAAKPERADDALEKIRSELTYINRSPELYDAMAGLAEAIGEPEVAELYRQNQSQLLEMRSRYFERVNELDAPITDGRPRMELGDLARELRDFEAANYWYAAAGRCDDSLSAEVEQKMNTLYSAVPELVPTPPAEVMEDPAARAARRAGPNSSFLDATPPSADANTDPPADPAASNDDQPASDEPADPAEPAEPQGEAPGDDGTAGADPPGGTPENGDPSGASPARETPASDSPSGNDPANEDPAGDNPAVGEATVG